VFYDKFCSQETFLLVLKIFFRILFLDSIHIATRLIPGLCYILLLLIKTFN